MLRRYLACYALYLVLLPLSYGVFVVWSQAVLLVVGISVEEAQARPFFLGVGLLVIVIGLFFLVLGAEPYLRVGVARKELRARFLRLAIPLVVALVVGAIAQDLLRVLGEPKTQ